MPVRHVAPDDDPALRSFLGRVPHQDASFLKEDLDDSTVIDAWLRAGRTTRLVHVDSDNTITAVASIAPGVGRSDHVAELRLVVDAGRRRTGIGRELAQQAVLTALREGYRKLTVEVGATQDATVNLFRGLGFTPEALHHGQVRADDGQLLDIVVLALSVEDSSAAVAVSGQAASS
jgi:L-amino acid N-acyltransferase YncA